MLKFMKLCCWGGLLLLVAGCQTVSYRMVPPASESGRLCVTQCAGNREMCLGREQQNARHEQRECERREEREYRRCMDRAEGKADRQKKCERQRGYCGSHANTGRCEEDHRACYASCGGRVIRVVEEW